ncbi:MAG: hypothetical protein M1827_004266 [Pycnora praestabilis]|nr:MAG: hypothetical protein M1827_004266 [Pycnora praestabilis]
MEDSSSLRRRRVPGAVTPNACTECRRRRAKCDGKTPCSRCAAADKTACVYEIHPRTAKETMKAKIDQLQARTRLTDQILKALVHDEQSSVVVRQLRDGEALESIVSTISSMPSSEADDELMKTEHATSSADERSLARTDPSQSTSTEPQPSLDDLIPGKDGQSPPTHESFPHTPGMRLMSKMRESGAPQSTPGPSPSVAAEELPDEYYNSAEPWTRVTDNEVFINHLVSLYFCWEYPTFASLSKEHFLYDFTRGRRRYCSSLLVNALLALGCRFTDHPEARADPTSSDTAGDHFFEEAKALLERSSPSLPTIQALGLMSLREASCGRDDCSWFFSHQSIRMAVELGLHVGRVGLHGEPLSRSEREVRAATLWGSFALDQAWCLSIGQIPQLSRGGIWIDKPTVIDKIEVEEWVPYSDDGMPPVGERNSNQPSNIRSVYKSFCELSEIVNDALYMFYTPGGRLTSEKILATYRIHLEWYGSLPDELRLGQNFTPSVLFAHMYYHFAILLLFRPFIRLSFSGSAVSPREICTQAAENISQLMRSYRQLYTVRRTPSFVPIIALNSNVVHLLNSSTLIGSAYCVQGLDDLTDMCGCHGFAKVSVDIIRYLAHKWDIPLSHARSEYLDATDDPSKLCRPSLMSMNFFCPNIEQMAFESLMRASPTTPKPFHPLFSLFPNQGSPLLTITNHHSASTAYQDNLDELNQVRLKEDGFLLAPMEDVTEMTEVQHEDPME